MCYSLRDIKEKNYDAKIVRKRKKDRERERERERDKRFYSK